MASITVPSADVFRSLCHKRTATDIPRRAYARMQINVDPRVK